MVRGAISTPPNYPVERTADSHAVAVAAHRAGSAYLRDRPATLMPEHSPGPVGSRWADRVMFASTRGAKNGKRTVLMVIALFALARLSAATYGFGAHSPGYWLFCPFANGLSIVRGDACPVLMVPVFGSRDHGVGRARQC